jgi:cysteine desulfurase/selenocysteine lyase
MSTTDDPDRKALRALYPGLAQGTYVDTSSLGLMAKQTVDAAQAELQRLAEEGSGRFIHWMMQGQGPIRQAVSDHIGGDPAGLALLQSFTSGMSRLAPLLRHRRKVLLVGGDYPTLHGPFKWNGFEVVLVEPAPDGNIPMERLAAAVETERPGIVAISQVQWTTGFSIDLHALHELCRANGAWSLVDATQSWCCAPIHLREAPIDILGASGYKWPLAGAGNGFFHLAEHVRAELAERNGHDPVAALSEGHLDPAALVRLHDAVLRAADLGQQAIAARVRQLTDLAVEQLDRANVKLLNGRDPAHRAGILMIEGDQQRLDRMRQAGVQAQLRGAGIRIGLHHYNNGEDVERLVESCG